MSGYVDLHCHFVAQIDDGCRTIQESLELLTALKELGFSHVVATPHMRPGMFDNQQSDLRQAYLKTMAELAAISAPEQRPETSLASEHFFDALIVEAIHSGRGLPYAPTEQVELDGIRQGGAILVEFLDLTPVSIIERQLFRLLAAGYLPVIAHPERYRQVWQEPVLVQRLQDAGCVALLDSAALIGKYGHNAQECARLLMEEGTFHAACSDAHRPSDAVQVRAAMHWIVQQFGAEELDLLFRAGPSALLRGLRPASMA